MFHVLRFQRNNFGPAFALARVLETVPPEVIVSGEEAIPTESQNLITMDTDIINTGCVCQ